MYSTLAVILNHKPLDFRGSNQISNLTLTLLLVHPLKLYNLQKNITKGLPLESI